MDNSEYSGVITPLVEELDQLNAKAIEIGKLIVGSTLLLVDLGFVSLLNRSVQLTDGFISMVKERNLTCAGALLRLQLDISEEEKQRTCKEVLCFMYCLSPDHIESHIPDAIHEIQKWMADIRTNEEFDIIANPKKRIIHLYDIPLSAGLGENILDSDIPFVEYETDVEDGDFALHVSGDSMEPDIPNGSTVFVKKQSEISDGINGAFFLNGEVYCKKLLHKDGKVFLCSDNAEYQPIEVHDGDTLIVYGKIVKVLC